MKTNSELLLGTWIGDSEDIESIQQFGNVKLHFTADGQLNPIIKIIGHSPDGGRIQIISQPFYFLFYSIRWYIAHPC